MGNRYLVSVVGRFVWSLDRDSQIVGLVLAELGQVNPKSAQMGGCHLLA